MERRHGAFNTSPMGNATVKRWDRPNEKPNWCEANGKLPCEKGNSLMCAKKPISSLASFKQMDTATVAAEDTCPLVFPLPSSPSTPGQGEEFATFSDFRESNI